MEKRKLAVLAPVVVAVAFIMGIAFAAPRHKTTPGAPAKILASEYALAAPGANTNILSADIEPTVDGSVFRVTVVLTTSSVFNMTETDGTTAYTHGLNESGALNAGDRYTFIVGSTRLTHDYNFQVETDGIIKVLQVEEVIEEAF